jgi:RNA polymerase sigma factor (sigma-70 family)
VTSEVNLGGGIGVLLLTRRGGGVHDFGEFYAATKDAAFRAVLAAVGERSAAEDAVSEAYARALARWSTVREHPNPFGWVLRTALNVQRSWWRRLRREAYGADAEHGVEQALPSGADPALRAAIKGLPERQRQVLGLRLVAQLSPQETAEVLGIAVSTVNVHLHRALVALRTELSPVDSFGKGPTS